jgi:hypothetical protein
MLIADASLVAIMSALDQEALKTYNEGVSLIFPIYPHIVFENMSIN